MPCACRGQRALWDGTDGRASRFGREDKTEGIFCGLTMDDRERKDGYGGSE